MAGMNKAILIGRVGRDPDVKTFSNGGKIVNFSIATSETWRDKQTGEKKEKTEWHNVTVQNEGICGVVEKYVAKGDMVAIEGKIQTRKWQDQSGNDRYTTEIVIPMFGGSLHLLGGNGGGGRRDDDEDGEGRASSSTGSRTSRPSLDDEVPF
jgi:single-strand DNA-binding protein